MRNFYKPLLGGHPPLSGHFGRSRRCPLNRSFTVSNCPLHAVHHHGGCENNSIDFTGGVGRKAMDRIVGGGGGGGVGGCGSCGGCGMTKGTFKSDDGNGNEDGQNPPKNNQN